MSSQKGKQSTGSALVVGATLIAGLGGYAIVTLMARTLGQSYAEFAVFWALLYLAIGTFSGIQQEVSRGTSRVSNDAHVSPGIAISLLSVQLSLVVAIVSSMILAILAPLFFSQQLVSLSAAVVSGATLSVFVGVLAGGLYGTHSWNPLAVLIISDVVFRLVLLAIFTTFTKDVSVLAWVCSIPFILVLSWVIPLSRKTVNRSTSLDVPAPQAYKNIGRTVGASFGTAILVSGFPALLAVSEGVHTQNYLGPAIYALTLTRAPLVVGILALQSFLIVKFRDFAGKFGLLLLKINVGIFFAGLLLSICAFVFGNQVIVLLAGAEYSLSPGFLFVLTLSSVPTAWLAVTGAATLSRKLHTSYSLGWIIAAAVSTATLFIPNALDVKLTLALVVGPLVGVLLNFISLAKQARKFSRPSA
jgi:O-antigen/teichoic acid export membrane protein